MFAPRDFSFGPTTVLIVDADLDACAALHHMVRGVGYDARAARDAREALRLLRAHRGQIPLLLTDALLPGMDGGELGERAKDLNRGIKVVLMTDNSADAASLLEAYPELPRLQKPVRLGPLYHQLRTVLGRPPSQPDTPRPLALRRRRERQNLK